MTWIRKVCYVPVLCKYSILTQLAVDQLYPRAANIAVLGPYNCSSAFTLILLSLLECAYSSLYRHSNLSRDRREGLPGHGTTAPATKMSMTLTPVTTQNNAALCIGIHLDSLWSWFRLQRCVTFWEYLQSLLTVKRRNNFCFRCIVFLELLVR